MTSNNEKLRKISIRIASIILIILIFIKNPNNIEDWVGVISSVVSITAVPILIYERWIWKINPFSKTPHLKESYLGKIKYFHNNQTYEKYVYIEIKQTFTSVSVSLKSNEITSKSVVSDIIEEHGDYVLYYTYTTNPKSEFIKDNPIQLGTARLLIKKNHLEGSYWTNQRTIGDIEFTSKE